MRRQPLGLLYIASALKDRGHIVSLINCHTPKSSTIDFPEEFAYLKKYLYSDEDLKFPFNNYNHFGMSFQEIDRQIKQSEAEIFFISSLFTTYYQEVCKIISIIKSRKKNCIIVVGGYHAALYPEFFLKTCEVDYVITGEGDISAVKLLNCMNDDEDILTMIGWSKTAMDACSSIDKPIVYLLEETGLWGDAVRERQPVITNDYKNLQKPTKKGYPEGHVNVIRHMNIPVFQGDKIVAVCGVGNKEAEYTQSDGEMLIAFMDSVYPVLKPKL